LGGKTSTSQQSVAIPPQVLAQYASVNSQAQATAATPFQTYSGEFVAPVNSEQTTGINATTAAANEAQPGYTSAQNTLGTAQAGTTGINDAATGLAAGSAEQVNADPLTGQQINSYLSPYLSDVLGSTAGLLNQNNQQQQSGQLGTAIQSGAFGSDRTGIAAANLEQQQNLANANIYSGIANTGYNNALGVAQQQQGVNLSAGQANRAALGSAGSELASIGQTAYGEGANTASEEGALASGAQTAGLQGANAEIAAGTVQQQTQQAQDTAEYNQFLQQQSYPFQVDQFLANIAEGTGALSGSTTTTTQPGGFFSDRRLKHDIKKIGKTYDNQTIYSYKMHGDNRTHIGLMAQEVEKKRPRAVGVDPGSHYKMVDYGAATEEAANRGHFYSGGVVPLRRASGGPAIVDPADLSAILQAQQNMYAPMASSNGVYGGAGGSVPRGGSSRVPAPSGATPHLVTASGNLRAQPTPAQNMQSIIGLSNDSQKLYDSYKKNHPSGVAKSPPPPAAAATPGDSVPVQTTTTTTTPGGLADAAMPDTDVQYAARGGVAGRTHKDGGGGVDYSGLVSAHGAMYGQGQQRKQEDIPNEGGSHQLAVASGTPAPPPSGASNANQGLGLAQKGYQVYNHFNQPSTAVHSFDTPDATSQALDATAPAADSSTISGIASTAPAAASAADTAGSGAVMAGGTDAAISGGADAAVGAGVDAAATEGAVAIIADAAPLILAARRGGAIKRRGYDAGGMPYSNSDGSLDIPDTSSGAAKLQTAGPLVKQPTGLQTALTMGNPNNAGTMVGSMFSNTAANRGGRMAAGGVTGRRGFDDGGDVDPTDDPNYAPSGVARGKIDRTGSGLLYTKDAGSSVPYGAPPLRPVPAPIDADAAQYTNGNYGPMADYKFTPPGTGLAGGASANPGTGWQDFGAKNPSTWNDAPTSPATSGLGAANTSAGPPTPVQQPVNYTGGVDLQQPAMDLAAASPDKVKTPSWWENVMGALKDSGITSKENLIPLLTGIAAMGTAPTKHLGVALAAGLGAGAQSYMPTQEAQADVAQTKANTRLTGVETQGAQIGNLQQLQAQYALKGLALYPDATGPIIGLDGQHYTAKPRTASMGASPAASGTAPQQYRYLGKNGLDTAKNEGTQYSMLPDDVQNESNKKINDIYQSGSEAQEGLLHTQHWEQVMAANKGFLDPGSQSELRTKAVNMWNTAMDAAHLPQAKMDGLSDSQMAQKMSIGAAAAGENANQQRSFGALKTFLAATPNTDMQREASIPLIADLHTQQQQAIDKKNYYHEFDAENQRNFGPLPQHYNANDAQQAFDKDYPANNYEGERDKLAGIIASGGFADLSTKLKTPPGATESDRETYRQKMYKAIDGKYGPNFHRYFTGS
jgi:hypothetical protein